MADKARKATDKELVRLENKIAKIYKQSQKELREQWAVYMEQSAVQIIEQQKAYDNALKTNDSKKIKKAKEALADAKFKQTVFNEHYRDMIDQVTTKFAQVNKIALAYINDKMPKIYAINHNAIAPTADSLGIDFTIVNEHAVRNLIKSGDIKLPHKELNVAKDKRWNTKKLNSSVLQGIIQGNSMDEIADRILPVVDNNKNAAIRNARTMVTGAENQGKLDSFFELQEMGTVVRKKWIAVPDERTRTWHLVMDGQEQELKDKFVDGNGNRLMFPADPTSKPETVYNCRCGMEAVIIGFKDSNGNINYVDRSLHEDTGHHAKVQEELNTRNKTNKKTNVGNAQFDIDKEIPDKIRKYILMYEAKYVKSKVEHYVAINKSGEVIYESGTSGKKREVTVPKYIDENNEGGYSIHNHPAPVTFSVQDIKMYEEYGQHGFVIDKDNYEHILFNENPKAKYKIIKNIDESRIEEEYEKIMPFYTAANKAFNEIEDNVIAARRKYSKELMEKESNSSVRSKMLREWMEKNDPEKEKIKWLTKNAKKYGFVYIRRKRK